MPLASNCRRAGPILLSLLLSGCASSLQKSLDRSIAIEQQCTIIDQALPMHTEQLKDSLVNAVALRLVGTCLDNSLACLGPGTTTSPMSMATTTRDHLATVVAGQKMALGKIRTDSALALRQFQTEWEPEYAALETRITQNRDATLKALAALHTELEKAKAALKFGKGVQACSQRVDCMTIFANQIAASEKEFKSSIDELKTLAAQLYVLAVDAKTLTSKSMNQLAQQAGTALKEERRALEQGGQALDASATELSDNAKQLSQRLANGAQTMKSLYSKDIETATMDLMAAKLYDKVAERLLVLIDRALSQLDHVIDKADDHLYGGATVAAQLFSGDIQERFDVIIDKLLKDKFKDSASARLAFAAAACQRMGMGDSSAAPVKNASMFSPFLFATLVRVQVDISRNVTLTPKMVRDAWEKGVENAIENKDAAAKAQADKPAAEQPVAQGPVSKQEAIAQTRVDIAGKFNTAIVDAKARETSATDGSKAVAPSMEQKVAWCATVEQEQAIESKTGVASKDRTLAACGQAALDSTMNGTPLADVGNKTEAAAVLEKTPPAPPAGIPGGTDAKAWQEAMQAVLAAALPKAPLLLDALCTQITSQIKGSRCVGGSTLAALDFDASFALGRPYDNGLEMQLAKLADILRYHRQDFVLVVTASASRKAPTCPRRTPQADMATCTGTKNAALADERAQWAFNILQQRMAERFGSGNQKIGKADPLSYDTPEDRRLRITLQPR